MKEECPDCGLLCYLAEHAVIDCQERQIKQQKRRIRQLAKACEWLLPKGYYLYGYDSRIKPSPCSCKFCHQRGAKEKDIQHTEDCKLGKVLKQVAGAKDYLSR